MRHVRNAAAVCIAPTASKHTVADEEAAVVSYTALQGQHLQKACFACMLQVSLVKGYVGRQLAKENTVIQQDRDAIARLQAETAAMKAEVVKLKTQPRVFQNSRWVHSCCCQQGQSLIVAAYCRVMYDVGVLASLCTIGEHASAGDTCLTTPMSLHVTDVLPLVKPWSCLWYTFYAAIPSMCAPWGRMTASARCARLISSACWKYGAT